MTLLSNGPPFPYPGTSVVPQHSPIQEQFLATLPQFRGNMMICVCSLGSSGSFSAHRRSGINGLKGIPPKHLPFASPAKVLPEDTTVRSTGQRNRPLLTLGTPFPRPEGSAGMRVGVYWEGKEQMSPHSFAVLHSSKSHHLMLSPRPRLGWTRKDKLKST